MNQRSRSSQAENLLGPEERQAALALVRESVEVLVRDGRRLGPPAGALLAVRRCPAFVTITLRGALRGCIGVLDPPGSLDQTLIQCALAAATEDPRFPPVSAGELQTIRFEISLLSPPRPVISPEEVEVGLHGVLVQSRGRQGLLLPQVPLEQGWDRTTFLSQACGKAGLSRDAWRSADCRLSVFTAEVFGEDPSDPKQKGRTA
jgi:AmmeMemoRadiSam system protein A